MSGTGVASGSAGVAANAVNAVNPVVWHKDKVGTEPGQEQQLTITFKKRDGNKIIVDYEFKSGSLGADHYPTGTRYNRVTITIGSTSHTLKDYNSYNYYNVKQPLGTVTLSGTFTFYGIPNGTTAIAIHYKNERKGPNEPFISARTTGNQPEIIIGVLAIPDNTQNKVSFHKAYKNGKITDIPEDITKYKYSTVKIPSNILKDKANHYVFNQGYSTTTSGETTYIAKSDPRFMEYMRDAILLHWVPPDPIQAHGAVFFKPDDVNTKKPEKGLEIGDTLTIEENTDLYACWYPQTYTYKFFHSNSSNSKKYKNPDYQKKQPADSGNNVKDRYLTRYYTYTKKAVNLPNFNDYTENNSINNNYYKIGYAFNGWLRNNDKTIYLKNVNIDSDTTFYPSWSPIKSKIIFNYGFDNYIRSKSYTYDTNFDFNTTLLDKSGNKKSNTLIRPGYKLIGWTYDESASKKIYKPREGTAKYKISEITNIELPPSTDKKYCISNKQFKDDGLNLYAVWEYYTTVYVYDGDKWKAAIPYVYNKGKWKLTQAYGYTNLPNDQNPTWKR